MTDEAKALVERLRSGRWLGETTGAEAADHIERLETQNEGYKLALAEQLQIRQQLEAELMDAQADNAIGIARIAELEADNALLREALEDFVACVGVSDDPDILMVDACAYENATRVLGVRG